MGSKRRGLLWAVEMYAAVVAIGAAFFQFMAFMGIIGLGLGEFAFSGVVVSLLAFLFLVLLAVRRTGPAVRSLHEGASSLTHYAVIVGALVAAPLLGYAIWTEGFQSDLPVLEFVVLALPPLLMAVIAWFSLRRAVELFYGVNMALLFIAWLRLFVARAATPATNLVFFIVVMGMLGFIAAQLFSPSNRTRMRDALLHTPTGLVGAWVAMEVVLLLPPMIVGTLHLMFEAPVALFVLGFFSPVLVAIVLTPIAVAYLYGRTWWRSVLAGGYQTAVASGVLAAVLVGMLVHWSINQPQRGVLVQLEARPVDRASIAADEARLRRGLVEIVLSPFRYWGPPGELSGMRMLYRDAGLPWWSGVAAQWLQEGLLTPLIYDGPGTVHERASARQLYRAVFDADIESAHREEFHDALISTWNWRPDFAATMADSASRAVLLTRQEVTIEPRGPLADVLLHEVYVNQTRSQREVVYHLELPETAVVTGLWLGSTDRREEAFEFRVSPRGAAQAVYKAQVARRVDPALLEQVGPRQYRLRIFPIQPDEDRRSRRPRGPPMHLWLAYRTLPSDGAWPLPRVLETRNVFSDGRTVRSINAKRLARSPWGSLPESVPVSSSVPAPEQTTVAGYRVSIAPATPQARPTVNGRWVVALDTSRSMAEVAEEVDEALAILAPHLPEAELIWVMSPFVDQAPMRVGALSDSRRPSWFGGLSLPNIYRQLVEAKTLEGARGLLVLTDAGDGVQVEGEIAETPQIPVWFLHLGGRPAIGYDDRFLEALQRSGGGVSFSPTETLRRMARDADRARAKGELAAAVPGDREADGWLIHFESAPDAVAVADDPLAPLVTRWLIEARAPLANGDPAELDQWHRLAQGQGIVTPFSSMIVLVNDQQHRQLDAAEQAADRFERETETGQTDANVSGSGFDGGLFAVPEPSTWILLGAGAGLALLSWRRRRVSTP